MDGVQELLGVLRLNRRGRPPRTVRGLRVVCRRPGPESSHTDGDLAATALREAHEEVGLPPARVRLLGVLDDIETVATRFVITPFVGVVAPPYDFHPCPREVDAIFSVPLRVLQAPDAEHHEVWDFDGRAVPIDTYPVDGHVIWGATQRITRNLLGVLRTLA